MKLFFLFVGTVIAAAPPNDVERYANTLRKKHRARDDDEIRRMAREHLDAVPRVARDLSQPRRATLAQWNRIDRMTRYELYTVAYETALVQLELVDYPRNKNIATDEIIAKMRQQMSYRSDFPPFPDVVLQEAVGRAKLDLMNRN